jgi:hypothetical protein
MSRKIARRSMEGHDASMNEDVVSGTRAEIIIEPDGTIIFVSLFKDLLPVAAALDPAIGLRFISKEEREV